VPSAIVASIRARSAPGYAAVIADPAIRDLIGRVEVFEDAAMTAAYPGALRARIEATMADGTAHLVDVQNVRGHYKNPLTDAEIEAKFRSLAEGVLSVGAADALLGRLWAMEDETSVDGLMRSAAAEGASHG
jgi:2-methylcitrate dehydratase